MEEYFKIVNEQTKALILNKHVTNGLEFLLTNGYLKIYDYYHVNKKIPSDLSYYRGVIFNQKWTFAELTKVLDKLIAHMTEYSKTIAHMDADSYGVEKYSSEHYIILDLTPQYIYKATHIIKKNTDIIFTSRDTILISRGAAVEFSFPKNDFIPSRFIEHYHYPDELAPYILGSTTSLRPGKHYAKSIGPVSILVPFGTISPEIYIIDIETPINNYYQAILTKNLIVDKKIIIEILEPATLFEIKKKIIKITLIYTKKAS